MNFQTTDYPIFPLEYIIQLVMVKGYTAYDEANDNELEIHPNEMGLVRVYLDDDSDGTIRVYYEGTAIQKISVWVTLAGIVLVISALILTFIKIKKKKQMADV